ncbi:MAG: hypothetical protein AAFX76_08600 [Planctomycetota bacterium]
MNQQPSPVPVPAPPADVALGRRLNVLMLQQAAAMKQLSNSFAAYEKLIENEPWLTHGYRVA